MRTARSKIRVSLIAGAGDESLQKTMARPYHLCAVQREQLDAVDSIQYYNEHRDTLLQCFEFPSEYDKHDIYDNVHSADISR